MTMVEIPAAEVEDPEGGSSPVPGEGGPGGGQVLQAGLAAELDAHLDGEGEGNRRNGSSAKTLNTEVGPVRVAVPRDRDGSFDPVLVPKQARRSEGLDAVVTSL